MSNHIPASGSDEAWMCYYFDAEKQKNMVITARPMTKHQAVQHAKAANKYYAGRQLVQVCQIPNWTPAESANEKADLPPTGARQPRSGTETTNGG